VKQLISDQMDIGVMQKRGVEEGMRTLRLSGADKVALGQTTIEEVLRVAPQSGYG